MMTIIFTLMLGIVIGFLLGIICFLVAEGLFEIDLSRPHDKYN
jgi:uncharacterized protein involved in exopolysaccharide biosynthesis